MHFGHRFSFVLINWVMEPNYKNQANLRILFCVINFIAGIVCKRLITLHKRGFITFVK